MSIIHFSCHCVSTPTWLSGAIVSALVLATWPAIAQETKPPASQEKSSPAAVEKKSTGQTAKKSAAAPAFDKATLEKLIVGTWRGGASGNDILVFQKDGTYGWLFQTEMQQPVIDDATLAAASATPGTPVNLPPVQLAARYANNSGRWRIEKESLVLTQEDVAPVLKGFREWKAGQAGYQSPEQWPADFAAMPGRSGLTAKMDIMRLDDSWLRLVGTSFSQEARMNVATSPKFFRRVDDKVATPIFTSEVPKEFKKIAELSRLNAEEAQCLAKWISVTNDERKNAKQPALNLELIEHGLAARSGKLDFAELFHLTNDEAAAYRDLIKLAETFSATCVLAEQGQLTPLELSALNKLKKYKTETDVVNVALMRSLSHGVPFPVGDASGGKENNGSKEGGSGSAAESGSTASQASGLSERAYYEMLYKLQTLLIELDSWLVTTVYN